MSNLIAIETPNFTQIPNVMIDNWMSTLPYHAFMVAIAIARKTFGWHKKADKISLNQLQEMTRLSRPTILKSITLLQDSGVLNVIKGNHHAANSYELVIGSKPDLPLVVNDVYHKDEFGSKPDLPTKEIEIKENKDISPIAEKALSTQTVKSDEKTDKRYTVTPTPEDNPIEGTAKPDKPKRVNPAYELIPSLTSVFGIEGNRALAVAIYLTGSSKKDKDSLNNKPFIGNPATHDELMQFKAWYKAKYDNVSLPQSLDKIVSHVLAFRAEKASKVTPKYVPTVAPVIAPSTLSDEIMTPEDAVALMKKLAKEAGLGHD